LLVGVFDACMFWCLLVGVFGACMFWCLLVGVFGACMFFYWEFCTILWVMFVCFLVEFFGDSFVIASRRIFE